MRRIGLLAAAPVLALALVACGDDDQGVGGSVEDDAAESPTSRESSAGPRLGDHWHLAIGFTRCGERLPVLDDAVPDETGVHSHDDGLIHVHPFSNDVSGKGAVLGRFFDTVGTKVTGEAIETPEWSLPFSGECDGEPARLMLATWPTNATDGSAALQTVVGSAEQLRALPLSPDGAVIAIGLATEGEQLSIPDSASQLESPGDVTSATSLPPATGRGAPADVDFGLAPVLGVSETPCSHSATPDAEGTQCFELGPVSIGADAIARAEAQEQGFGWIVFITLTPAGEDGFDSAATSCFERSPECPSGLLAIVLEGKVLSAPSVQQPEFDGELTISGDFSEAQAKELADALSS